MAINNIIVEDWWLKPMMRESSVYCFEKGSGKYIGDFKSVGRNVRVVGTKKQIYNLFCKMLDQHGWQIKDDWNAEMKDEYIELYKKNNNKPLIINLI